MEKPWWSPSFVDLNEKPLVEFLFTKIEGGKSITFLYEISSPCGYYHGRYLLRLCQRTFSTFFINRTRLSSLAAVNVSHNLLVNMKALLMHTNNGPLIHMTEIV